MGEARRRAQEGFPQKYRKVKKKIPQSDSKRIVTWLPVTEKQRSQFIDITIKGGWVGIGLLVTIWLVVRILGPALGWWVPADLY